MLLHLDIPRMFSTQPRNLSFYLWLRSRLRSERETRERERERERWRERVGHMDIKNWDNEDQEVKIYSKDDRARLPLMRASFMGSVTVLEMAVAKMLR